MVVLVCLLFMKSSGLSNVTAELFYKTVSSTNQKVVCMLTLNYYEYDSEGKYAALHTWQRAARCQPEGRSVFCD